MNRRDLIRTAFLALVAAPTVPLLGEDPLAERRATMMRIWHGWHLLYEHTIDWRSRRA